MIQINFKAMKLISYTLLTLIFLSSLSAELFFDHQPTSEYSAGDKIAISSTKITILAVRDVPAGIATDDLSYWIDMTDTFPGAVHKDTIAYPKGITVKAGEYHYISISDYVPIGTQITNTSHWEQKTLNSPGAVPDIDVDESTFSNSTPPLYLNFSDQDILVENTSTGARSVWNLNGARWQFQTEENLLSGGATVGTYSSSTIVFGSGDFDNDGNVDIAISDTSTGDTKIIFMNGNLEVSQVNIGTLATTDKPVAVADFNSDGLIDVITDNVASGLKKIHFLTGSGRSLSINSQITVTTDTQYSIVGAADFDQDGNPDLLVEQITSDTDPSTAVARVIWLMNGYTVSSTTDVFPPFRQEWRMKGVGDFDNDQNIDIMVEQDGTGRKGIWYLNRTSLRDGFTYLTLQPDWKIGCSGDFNSDGSNDPVFYNLSSGKVIVLNLSNQSPEDNQFGNKYAFLNINTSFLSASTSNAGIDWKMRGFIDHNGDNQLEVLADNTSTGEKAIWQIESTSNTLVSTVFATEPNWRMCATGAFGGDLTTDIVAENISSGEKQFWIMSYSGDNFTVSSKTTFAIDSSFRIVGAGDFNNDSQNDLVLEYLTSSTDPLASVKRKIWYFNGVSKTGEHEFLDFRQEWRMRGVLDYDNNGHPDILVEQDNMGRKGIWAMLGSSIEYGFTFTTVGPQWTFPTQ
jgi:hypothetical protein